MKKLILILFIISCNILYSQQINFNEIPQNLQFYARDINNKANIALSGNVVQLGFDSIIVNVYRNNFPLARNPLKLNYLNGIASFSFQIPINSEFAEYSITIHLDNIYITRRDSIVCGDVYLINGQSNSHPYGNLTYKNEYWRSFGQHTNTDAYNPADTAFGLATGWGWYNTPFAVGAWGIELQRLITNNSSIPVLILNGGSGGSSIEYNLRDNTNRTNLQTTYGRLLYRAQKAKLADKVKAIFWHQGESNSYPYSDLTYPANFDLLYNSWKQDYPNLKKVYVFQIHQGCGGDKQNEIREIQRNFAYKYSDVCMMSTVGLTGHDGCHYYNDGYNQMASWIYRLVARDFYNSLDTTDIKPPDVLRVYYADAAKSKIGIDFDQNIQYPQDYNGNSLKNYFYFDDIYYETVQNAYKSGNKSVMLELKTPYGYKKLTYLPNLYYNNSSAVYEGPWITGLRGVGALSFQNQNISDCLQITEQPQSQIVCSPYAQINLKTGMKGLIKQIYWQKSTNNGLTWINIPNSNSNNLTFTLNQPNYGVGDYRCIVKGEQLIMPDSVISQTVNIKFLQKAQSVNLTILNQQEKYNIGETLQLSVKSDGNAEHYILQQENQGLFQNIEVGDCNYLNEFNINRILHSKEVGNYRICLINSNVCGIDTVYSKVVNIDINQPVKLIKSSDSLAICNGGNVLIGTFVNSSIRTYQWFRNNIAIETSENPTSNLSEFLIQNLSKKDEGEYKCRVTAPLCDSLLDFFSDSIFIKVNSDYIITEEINNGDYFIGDTALLIVNTNNNSNTNFQWYNKVGKIADGKNFSGTNTNSLKIFILKLDDLFNEYYCITSQAGCSDTSSKFKLNISQYSITIDSQPDQISGCEGDSTIIKVISYSNCTSEKYEWFKDGLPLSDPDAHQFLSFITLVNLDKESEGNYQLKITGSPGNIVKWSNLIPVKVFEKPLILSQSKSDTKIDEGGKLELFVTSDSESNTYQWYKNNNPLENSKSNFFVIDNCKQSDEGIYFCELLNNCGPTKSNMFNVTIKPVSVADGNYLYTLLYPNPSTGEVTIKFTLTEPQMIKLSLYSLTGELVCVLSEYNEPGGEISKNIILPNIPSGTYFIKAEGRKFNNTYKVVIRK